jgi:hypothetical protein
MYYGRTAIIFNENGTSFGDCVLSIKLTLRVTCVTDKEKPLLNQWLPTLSNVTGYSWGLNMNGKTEVMVLPVVTPCSDVVGYQRFGGRYSGTSLHVVTVRKTMTWILVACENLKSCMNGNLYSNKSGRIFQLRALYEKSSNISRTFFSGLQKFRREIKSLYR